MHSARALKQISRDSPDRFDVRVAHRPSGIASQCRPPKLFFRTGIPPATLACTALACTALFVLSGCGYMLGNAFEPEIHTVHIPVFASNADRRGIEFMVTEAIHREVKQRSSLRLAKPPNAQTRLTGRIVDVRKDALGETRFDDTRELQLQLAVQVRWEDLRTGEVLAQQRIPLPANLRQLVATAEFAPEVGQSLTTANNQAVQNLAAQVVDMMELPW
ncbi:MAG: LPS assembly lipoprotein LptE [Planctomycetaceae bacterium]